MRPSWVFDNRTDSATMHTGSKPTPQRFRKLLRREQENLESLLPPEATPNTAGRDASGRFTKGNKGGTGNPFARQVAGFRRALVNAVTEADLAELAGVLLARSKEGDVAAMKLLFAYVLGRPAEAPDPDRLELDDFQLLRERLSPLKDDWLLIKKMVPVEGIVEAGHRVADLRGASWREEVLGEAQQPEAVQTRDVGTTQQSLNSPSADDFVQSLLAILREEAERTTQVLAKDGTPGTPIPAATTPEASAPSRNGANGEHPPSRNGTNGEHAPSRNGANGKIAGRPHSNGVIPSPEPPSGARATP